jgi:hypothetical protein
MTTCDFRKLPMITIGKQPETTEKRIEFRGCNLADPQLFGHNAVPYGFTDTDTAMVWINDNMDKMLEAIKGAWYPSVSLDQRVIDHKEFLSVAPCHYDNVRKYNQWIEQVYNIS